VRRRDAVDRFGEDLDPVVECPTENENWRRCRTVANFSVSIGYAEFLPRSGALIRRETALLGSAVCFEYWF
jgi:hypothetical protein